MVSMSDYHTQNFCQFFFLDICDVIYVTLCNLPIISSIMSNQCFNYYNFFYGGRRSSKHHDFCIDVSRVRLLLLFFFVWKFWRLVDVMKRFCVVHTIHVSSVPQKFLYVFCFFICLMIISVSLKWALSWLQIFI